MKRWLIGVGFVGILVAGLVAWLAQPTPRESLRISGRLLAVGYARGCGEEVERSRALMDWPTRVRERVLALVGRPLAYQSDCRVTGVRQARNVIVNAGENYLVSLWIEAIRSHRTVGGGGSTGAGPLSDFRFHGCGSEDTATAEAHTGLVSECTTQTDANNLRQQGTLIVGAGSNILRSVATIAFDATDVITEWGLFHVAAVNSGHMWSRVVVSPGIGVNSGDSITFTYDLTIE